MTEGYHLLKQGNDGLFYCYRIYNVAEEAIGQTHVKTVQAFNLCIWELYHKIVEAKTFNNGNSEDIFSYILEQTGWEVNQNDFFGGQKSYEISAGATAQACLDGAISTFSGEVRAYVQVYNGKVIRKLIDIVKELGNSEGRRFEYSHDLIGVKRTSDDTNFFTKLYVYGGTNSAGNTVTIDTVNDGKKYIVDDEVNDLYNNGNAYLEGYITNEDITNPSGLLDWGKEQFQNYNHPKYTYEVDVAHLGYKPNLGDHIQIVDFSMEPELTIAARVIQIEESEADSENTKYTLGEFVEILAVTPEAVFNLQEKTAQAYQAAQIAKANAETAQSAADNAQSTADTAQTIASSAETTAVEAQGTAVAAQSSANSAQSIANSAQTAAQNALTSANGKNTVYYSATQPTGTFKTNDLWFDTANGNRISVWDGSTWVLSQFGALAVTGLDAGSISTEFLESLRIKGDALELGGTNNVNGELLINDASGKNIVKGDNAGITVDGGAYYLIDRGLPVISTPLQNYVNDHSFELVNYTASSISAYEDYAIDADKWDVYAWSTTGDPRLKDGQGSGALFGDKMVCVNEDNYIKQHIPINEGQLYTLSVYAALLTEDYYRSSVSGALVFKIVFYDSDSVKLDTYNYDPMVIMGSNSWRRLQVSFTPPANAVEAIIAFSSDSSHWVYIDGVQMVQGDVPCTYAPEDSLWRYAKSRVPVLDHGNVSITPVANKPTSVHVSFNRNFIVRPDVVATAFTSVPGTSVQGVGVSNVDTNGFDLYIYRINDTSTTVFWMAMG